MRSESTADVTAVSLMAPVFEIPLCDVTVVDGEKAVLECRVNAQPQPDVTWYCESLEIKASQDFRIQYEDGMCTLEIMDVLPEDDRNLYSCPATTVRHLASAVDAFNYT